MLAQAAQHLEAVECGQHPVQDDDVRMLAVVQPQALRPVGSAEDAIAGGAELARHHLGQIGGVLDQQQRFQERTPLGRATDWPMVPELRRDGHQAATSKE